MVAVGRRVCKLSSIPGFGPSKSKVSLSSSLFHRAIFDPFPVSGARHFSRWVKSNGKHLFLVDTLALVRTLEGEGVPSKQADAIIAATTEVLKDGLENVSQSFVSKGELRKIEMMLESNLFKSKAEMQSSQGHHFFLLQHETEKLRNDVEKMRIVLRHDIDKGTAGLRSDFNLGMRKIREELSKQKAETNIFANKLDELISKLDGVSDNMTSKLEEGLDSLRAQLEAAIEAAKYDKMKYFMGTMVSITTVGLAIILRHSM